MRRTGGRWVPVVVAALLVVAVLAGRDTSDGADGVDGGAGDPAEPVGEGAVVVVGGIGDGDSFRLEDGSRVRMIGIDTPEVDEGECFAFEARDALRALLPRGSRIRLVLDAEHEDRFGRTLAYVFRADDDLFVNLELARRGYAEPLVVRPNVAHADEIADAADRARAEGLGRWAACPGP